MASILLREHQKDCAYAVENSLVNEHGVIINAPTGSGKTFLACWLSYRLGLPLYVICPASLRNDWDKITEEYDIDVIDIISYSELSSRIGSEPKHGLLTRSDMTITQGRRTTNRTIFTATSELKELLKKGVLFIFDESHNLKNDVAKTKAAIEITRCIQQSNSYSKFLLLSATIFDKEEHALQMLRVLGYLSTTTLIRKEKGNTRAELVGLEEIIEFSTDLDENETKVILDEYGLPQKVSEAISLCYQFWLRVFLPNLVFSMPIPKQVHGYIEIKNGLYYIGDQQRLDYEEAMEELREVMRRERELRIANRGAVLMALVRLETAKRIDMARIAIKTLRENPTCKVILALNYLVNVRFVADLLKDYNPLVYTGQVSFSRRTTINELFQEDNLNHRLLIINPTVGGTGVSFHDESSNHPRYMFISPSYFAINIIQTTGRIHRDGRGIGICRIFWCITEIDADQEQKLMESLIKKGEIIKDSTGANTIMLPCDYEEERESIERKPSVGPKSAAE